MIVIKNISRGIEGISCAAYTLITWTEVTISHIFRYVHAVRLDNFAIPGAVLAMRSNDHPLFAQGMPTLLPQALRGSRCMCVHALLLLKTVDMRTMPAPGRLQ